jgi:hypothetical protein
MEKRSILAYESLREAEQRFEYFLLGVSVALCAFAGQTLQPEKLGWSAYTFEIISILLIVASVVAGVRRLMLGVVAKRLNQELLHLGETRGQLVSALSNPASAMRVINEQTGDVFTIDQARQQVLEIEKTIPVRQKQLADFDVKYRRYFRWRNWLLLIGFLGFFVAKVLSPYFMHH